MKIELKGRPFTVLKILIERAGQIVTREELRQQLWSSDTHVDFDANLSTALRNVRRALEDSHKDSKYIETIPGEGYRFLESVFPLDDDQLIELERPLEIPVAPARVPEPDAPDSLPSKPKARRMLRIMLTIALAFVTLLLSISGYRRSSYIVRARSPEDVHLCVLPMLEAGSASPNDHFSMALTDEVVTKLTRLYSPRFTVVASTTTMHYKGTSKTIEEIAKELDVNYVLEGAILRSDDRVRVSVHLVEASTQSPLWAEDYDRPLGDLLSIQEDIADRIARTIALKVGPGKPLIGGEKAVGPIPH
jgi:TolB-like protein/DNA-binding winged helix-turn-helix (wHTH) protein